MHGLQTPQVCFLVGGVQRHDLTSYITKHVHLKYAEQYAVPPPKEKSHLLLYEEMVMTGMISWNTHLQTVACRQALWRPSVGVCPLCTSVNTGNHMLDTCPLRNFVHWYIPIKFLLWLPEVVPQWKDCTPTPRGTWIHRGGVTYILALRHPHTFRRSMFLW